MAKRLLVALLVASVMLAGCGPTLNTQAPGTVPPTQGPTRPGPTPTAHNTVPPTPRPTATPRPLPPPTLRPSPTVIPLPDLKLKAGDFYFTVDGHPQFVYSRNLTGIDQADFDTLMRWTRGRGSELVRIHLTFGWWSTPWMTKTGEVNEAWARNWEGFMDQAEADGMYVIPVFGVWADWNNGTPNFGGALWQYNPMNIAKGGPVRAPGELFETGSATQTLWLKWVESLVTRWQDRPNIAAWEIFSELNIASGAPAKTDATGGLDETVGVEFMERAAAVIRAADGQHRPLTASLAGTYGPNDPWADFYNSKTLDFIEIHPYADQLDRFLITDMDQKLAQYHKPVFIGESGLSAFLQLDTFADTAQLGIEHAIWAGMVSGAMNGRSLWFEDSYAIYWDSNNKSPSLAFIEAYKEAEHTAANFVQGVDFTGFNPLEVFIPGNSKVWGAAVGNDTLAIGWFRDASCEPPNWNLTPLLTQQMVTLTVPGTATNWQVDFYSPATGQGLGSGAATRRGKIIVIDLPDFTDAIAFKLTAKP